MKQLSWAGDNGVVVRSILQVNLATVVASFLMACTYYPLHLFLLVFIVCVRSDTLAARVPHCHCFVRSVVIFQKMNSYNELGILNSRLLNDFKKWFCITKTKGHWWFCYRLNIVPSNSYVESLCPNVMILRGGAFGTN